MWIDKFLFREFWRKWVYKYKIRWFIGVGLQLFFFATSAIIPFLWGRVTDSLAEINYGSFLQWIVIFFVIEILQIISLYTRNYQIRRLELDVDKDIKTNIYSKLHSISYKSILNLKTGDAIHRIMNEVSNCIPLIIQAFSELLGHIVLITIIMVMMFMLSPYLTFISIIFIGLYAIGYYYYQKRTPEYVKIRQQAQANLISTIEEGLDAVYSVRVQAGYRGVMLTFKDTLESYFARKFAFYKFNLLFQGVFSSLITFLMELGIIIIGAWLIFRNQLTVGAIISFSLYINWLVVFVNYLSSYAATVEPALVSLQRVNEIISQPDEWVFSSVESIEKVETNNIIEIKHLNFAYAYGTKPIFNDLNIQIPAKKTCVVRAKSGRGKSTLLNLLLKIYPVPDNSIFIADTDINLIPISKLLGLISVVEQEPKFFGEDLMTSITGGDNEISPEQMLQFSEKLGLYYFLEDLLARGSNKSKLSELSGGERKRLGMLRGLMRQTPITILDEPTAFLDETSARQLMEKIYSAYPERTFLIFSHDSLIDEFADNILNI